MAQSKFGFGLFVGAVLGGVAAFFLSPQSGKENREMAAKKLAEWKKKYEGKKPEEIAKEIFGTASTEGKALYVKAQSELNARLEEVKKRAEGIDQEAYKQVVDEVVSRLSKEGEGAVERIEKLAAYLKDRWEYVAHQAEEDAKKVVKGVKES